MLPFNTFSIFDLIAIMVAIPLTVNFYVRYIWIEKKRVELLYANLMALIAVFSALDFLQDNLVRAGESAWKDPATPARMMVLMRLAWAVGAFIVVAMLHFVLRYCSWENFLSRHISLAYAWAVAMFPMFWTPLALHPIGSPRSHTSSWKCAVPWLPEPGPLVLLMGVVWIAVFLYEWHILRQFKRRFADSSQSIALNFGLVRAGILVYFVSGMIDIVSGACSFPTVDLAPPGLAILCVLVAIGLVRDRVHSKEAARILHGSLLPPRMTTGPLHVNYVYEPMDETGGDLVYLHQDVAAGTPLSIVILDVTGHGIPAAITVTRLIGELDRLFAETRGPTQLIHALNRYTHLALQNGRNAHRPPSANHLIIPSALCMQIECNRDLMEWASAGHHPAFVYRDRTRTDSLDSTDTLLGVSNETDPETHSLPFYAGDVVVAYTDGATDASNRGGNKLCVRGVTDLIDRIAGSARRVDDWAAATLRELRDYRQGPPADDTLIVTIHRLADGSRAT
jgi:hypothetical protein